MGLRTETDRNLRTSAGWNVFFSATILFLVTYGIEIPISVFCEWGVFFVSEATEAEQFDSVVVPYLSDALTLARWLTGNTADAEDVVQEACLRAFRAIGSCGGSNARAWVLTIVRNTAFTWLAKNRKMRLVSFDELPSEDRELLEFGAGLESGGVSTPEQQLIALADADSLRAAIAQLSESFREVLVLREMQGLDYREISSVIGAPLGTVMSRLARARRQLILFLEHQQK